MADTERMLNETEVCEMAGLTSSQLREQVGAGEFPAPVKARTPTAKWLDGDFQDIDIAGLSRSRILEMVKAGEFPEPVMHPSVAWLWMENEVRVRLDGSASETSAVS